MTIDHANGSFLFHDAVSIEDLDDERPSSLLEAEGGDRPMTSGSLSFAPSTFGLFGSSTTPETFAASWTTAPGDSTNEGAKGGFPSWAGFDGSSAAGDLLAFDPSGTGNPGSGGSEDLLSPGEDPLEGFPKPADLPAGTDSKALYELYRNNRDLIIENNRGSGILADVYVNPTRNDGTPKGTAILDASFLDAKPFEQGIADNRSRFLEDTLSTNAPRMAELDVGESLIVRDHWDLPINGGYFNLKEYDIFQSIGTATLNSQGTFRITVTGFAEDGSREVRVDYATDHVLFDYYNWDATNGLTGVVNLGDSGEAVGADGKPLEVDEVEVGDGQMNDLREHGARYFPLAGVVRETGSLTGTVTTEGGFFSGRKSTFEPDAGGGESVREVITEPGYVLPLLERAIELNGGLADSVPPLTDAQRDNATVIGIDGYVDGP